MFKVVMYHLISENVFDYKTSNSAYSNQAGNRYCNQSGLKNEETTV